MYLIGPNSQRQRANAMERMTLPGVKVARLSALSCAPMSCKLLPCLCYTSPPYLRVIP